MPGNLANADRVAWPVRRLMCLTALLAGPALALSPLLKPVTLTDACQKGGYRVWTDVHGQARVLRFRANIPDNTRSVTQYYDSAGRLLTLHATFTGFAGLMYDLTARLDSQGNIVKEVGFRRQGDRTNLKTLVLDVKGVMAGQCPS